MKSPLKMIVDGAVVHGMVMGTAALFDLVRRADPRFRKALEGFDATYQFRTGGTAHRLIFDHGRIRTRPGRTSSPDYELNLLDPVGVVRRLVEDPNKTINLLMENKIDQRGNNYYLFKYGYLMGLADRWVKEQKASLTNLAAAHGLVHAAA